MTILEALLNRDKAHDMIQSEDDEAIKAILEMAKHQAYMRFYAYEGRNGAAIEAEMPEMPFDMLFYMRLLKRLLSNKELIQQILDGNVDIVNQI